MTLGFSLSHEILTYLRASPFTSDGLYYAIPLGCGAISPMIYGLITDSLGLSFTMISTALMVLITLPLSRYLTRPAKVL